MKINRKKILKGFIAGLLIGFGNPIPGVSAGTIAIMLNVYDKFFSSVSVAAAKKYAIAIIAFVLGNAAGLFAASSLLMFLFDYHGMLISFIFMGLIAGCVPMVYTKASANRVKLRNVIMGLAAFVTMILLAFYGGDLTANHTIEQLGGVGPGLVAWVFFTSIISSATMVIPGVGGSLIMIVFGTYTIYIEAIATLNILLLTAFAAAMVFGILAGIFVIKKMLERFSQTLYFIILGCIVGSLFIVHPGFYAGGAEGIIYLLLACVAFTFAYWLSLKEGRSE